MSFLPVHQCFNWPRYSEFNSQPYHQDHPCIFFAFDTRPITIWVFCLIRIDINQYFWPQKWPFFRDLLLDNLFFKGILWWPLFRHFSDELILNKGSLGLFNFQKNHNFQYRWGAILRIGYPILFDTVKRFEIPGFDRYAIRYSQGWSRHCIIVRSTIQLNYTKAWSTQIEG